MNPNECRHDEGATNVCHWTENFSTKRDVKNPTIVSLDVFVLIVEHDGRECSVQLDPTECLHWIPSDDESCYVLSYAAIVIHRLESDRPKHRQQNIAARHTSSVCSEEKNFFDLIYAWKVFVGEIGSSPSSPSSWTLVERILFRFRQNHRPLASHDETRRMKVTIGREKSTTNDSLCWW